jgi:hypothetical protein
MAFILADSIVQRKDLGPFRSRCRGAGRNLPSGLPDDRDQIRLRVVLTDRNENIDRLHVAGGLLT